MREFIIAAERVVSDEEAAKNEEKVEDLIELPIAGQPSLFARYPTTGQISLVYAARGYAGQLRVIHDFLRSMLVEDGYERVAKWLSEGLVDIGFLFGGDELNDGGLVEQIIQEAVGRPTGSPSGSSASPNSAGQRSTGRSPGKGSTRSNSGRTASSTSSSSGP